MYLHQSLVEALQQLAAAGNELEIWGQKVSLDYLWGESAPGQFRFISLQFSPGPYNPELKKFTPSPYAPSFTETGSVKALALARANRELAPVVRALQSPGYEPLKIEL